MEQVDLAATEVQKATALPSDEGESPSAALSRLCNKIESRLHSDSSGIDLQLGLGKELARSLARCDKAIQAGLFFAAEDELKAIVPLTDKKVSQQKEALGKDWEDFHRAATYWRMLGKEEQEKVLTEYSARGSKVTIDSVSGLCAAAVASEEARICLAALCAHIGKKTDSRKWLDEASRINPLVEKSELVSNLRKACDPSIESPAKTRTSDNTELLPNLTIEDNAPKLLNAKSLKELSRKYFDRIDLNNDGELSKTEIGKALQDKTHQGGAAVFVAVSKVLFQQLSTQDGPMSTTISGNDFRAFANAFDRQSSLEQSIMAFTSVLEHFDKLFPGKARVSVANLNTTIAKLTDHGNHDGTTEDLAKVIHQSRLIAPAVADYPNWTKFDKVALKGALDSLNAKYQDLLANDARLEMIQTEHANRRSELFADRNKPLESIKPEAVQQGSTGDCYFLAAMAAAAAVRPGALARAITDNNDGTYTVTFPGAKDEPITVDAPTEAELLVYAAGNNYGKWVAVMEKAYGAYCAKSFTRRHISDFFGTSHPTDATDGGTLNAGTRMFFSKYETLRDQPENVLKQKLAEAKLIGGSVIVARTATCTRKAQWAEDRHAYAVTDYDAKSGRITLRNPWGSRARGSEDQTTKIMTVSEFAREFNAFCFGR